MKIALIILHADPARGGAERYTADLAAALATRGHDVHLLATDFGPPMNGIRFVKMPSTGMTRTRQYQSFLQSLDAPLSTEKYDNIHAMLPVPTCHLYHPHAGLAALARNQLLNPRRRRFATVERELLEKKNPPIILCLSDYIKSAITRQYHLPPDRLVTLFNAVDLHRFSPPPGKWLREGRGGGSVTALMIAQDFDRKGLAQSITAIAQVNNPRLTLKVIGKPDPAKYRRQAAQLGIADRIIFAGPTDKPRDEYAAADFFLLPTRHDPCSLVVLESLAMGVPVISTGFNGACEIMTDGRHGYVLPDPNDIPALATAIRSMLDDPTRHRMAQACRELRPQLSFDAHVDRLLAIYSGIQT